MNNQFIQYITSDKGIRAAFFAVLAFLALFLATAFIGGLQDLDSNQDMVARSVTIEGTGKVTAMPNIARISFTVSETAKEVKDAQEKVTTRVTDALAYLDQQGVDEKDIKTTSYSVYPKYEYPGCSYGNCGPAVLTGYEVSQSFEVKVRDTAKAGDVLQGLGSQNVQNISGPNFGIDDIEVIRAEAREKAVADARAKAKELGKNLHVHLGDVVGFYENTYAYPMYDTKVMTMSAAEGMGGDMHMAPSLPTGENEYSVTVSVTYEIK